MYPFQVPSTSVLYFFSFFIFHFSFLLSHSLNHFFTSLNIPTSGPTLDKGFAEFSLNKGGKEKKRSLENIRWINPGRKKPGNCRV